METIQYRGWQIVLRHEWNGISADYYQDDGDLMVSPFSFRTIEEAEAYAKNCIDLMLRPRSTNNQKRHAEPTAV